MSRPNKNYFTCRNYEHDCYTEEAIDFIEREVFEKGWSWPYVVNKIRNGLNTYVNECESNDRLRKLYLRYHENTQHIKKRFTNTYKRLLQLDKQKSTEKK